MQTNDDSLADTVKTPRNDLPDLPPKLADLPDLPPKAADLPDLPPKASEPLPA